jgi:hypothetical protein
METQPSRGGSKLLRSDQPQVAGPEPKRVPEGVSPDFLSDSGVHQS